MRLTWILASFIIKLTCFSKINTMAYFLEGPLVVIWIFFFLWIVGKAKLCMSRILLLGSTRKTSWMYRIFSADMTACTKLHGTMALSCLVSAFFDFSLVSLLGQGGRGGRTWLILVALLSLTGRDYRGGWFLINWDLTLDWKVTLSVVLIWSYPALYIADTNVQVASPNSSSWGMFLLLWPLSFLYLRNIAICWREHAILRILPWGNLLVLNREVALNLPSHKLESARTLMLYRMTFGKKSWDEKVWGGMLVDTASLTSWDWAPSLQGPWG